MHQRVSVCERSGGFWGNGGKTMAKTSFALGPGGGAWRNEGEEDWLLFFSKRPSC